LEKKNTQCTKNKTQELEILPLKYFHKKAAHQEQYHINSLSEVVSLHSMEKENLFHQNLSIFTYLEILLVKHFSWWHTSVILALEKPSLSKNEMLPKNN
jgi:hypothetical protein